MSHLPRPLHLRYADLIHWPAVTRRVDRHLLDLDAIRDHLLAASEKKSTIAHPPKIDSNRLAESTQVDSESRRQLTKIQAALLERIQTTEPFQAFLTH
jgi:hypothetical protein